MRLHTSGLALILAAGLGLAACDDNAGAESNVAPQAGEVYSPMAPAGEEPPPQVGEAIPPGSRGNEGGSEAIYGGTAVDGGMSDGSDPGMGEPGVAGGSEGSMGESSPGGEAVTESELPQSDVPPPSREVFQDAECNFEAWVGKPVDEAAIKATGRPYRILTPNSMMTMDHSPSRINVEHEEGGQTVTRVWCG